MFWWTKSCLWSANALKSCIDPWSDSGDGFEGVDPLVLFIPEWPSLTGLTGAAHRPDQCRGSVGFASVEHLCEFLVVPSSCCFGFW
jgi:hypothetical protein